MEVCVPESSSSTGGYFRIPLATSLKHTTDLSVSDLKTCLNEVLAKDVVDVKISGENDTSSETREDDSKEVSVETKSTDPATSRKRLNKSATIPLARGEQKSSVDGFFCKEKQEDADVASEANASAYSVGQSYPRSISMPTPRKLVSALKGSREKHGIIQQAEKKLSITWAPDVYDPIPSSASHVPSSKNHRPRGSDGKRKSKQKRSSSKSPRGREKKETKKIAGASSSHKPNKHHRGLNEGCEMARAGEEFAAGNKLNPSCGSSLLKDSVAELRYSVAEAT